MGLRRVAGVNFGLGVMALALCSLALCSLAPRALAGSREVNVTTRYVRANYALVHAAYSRIKPVEARLRELLAQIRHECPNVADGSPEEELSVQLRTEIIGALVVSAVHLDIGAGRTFLAAVGGLSWANRSLTRSVGQYAARVSRMIALPAPNICADVESWVHSGYTTLPAFTEPFDTAFLASWVSPGLLPSGLRPFESPSLGGLLRRTEMEENAIVEVEAREVPILGQILDALGLH